jgi:cytochrome c-type biogenesis protein
LLQPVLWRCDRALVRARTWIVRNAWSDASVWILQHMSLSLPAIFAAGLLTFASPCVLPLMPIYLATLAGGSLDRARPRRLIAVAVAFVLGLGSVFVALGALATSFGALLTEHRTAISLLSGALMLLFGARALGLLRLSRLDRDVRPGLTRVRSVSSVAGSFLFGAAFALGWSPCIGPVLAAVLTYAAANADNPSRGALYLAVYAAGLSLPLLVLAAFAGHAGAWVRRVRGAIPKLEMLTGVALIAMGGWMVATAVGALSAADSSPTADARPAGEGSCANGSAPGHTCALPDVEPSAAAAELPIAEAQFIEFGSQDCPVCRRMRPVVEKLMAACTELDARITHVDVTTAEGRALADRHRVRGTPTFVLLDGRGNERARLLGDNSSEALSAALEQAFGVSCSG